MGNQPLPVTRGPSTINRQYKNQDSRTAHIDRELAPKPLKLGRVRDQPTDPANMWFLDIDGLGPKSVDDHQVLSKHIRALVIFGGDVLRDRIRQ